MGSQVLLNQELAICLDKLRSDATTDNDSIVLRFLLDQITESDFLGSLSPDIDRPRRCAFWYYVGMKRLFAADKRSAAEAFRACISTEERTSVQYHAAQAELRALEH